NNGLFCLFLCKKIKSVNKGITPILLIHNKLFIYSQKNGETLKNNKIKKTRGLVVYDIIDEIAINAISNIIFRYYENLIPYNSYANILDSYEAPNFYKSYYSRYRAFNTKKFELIKSHKYNKLLITDIIKFYDQIDIKIIIDIMKKYSPQNLSKEEDEVLEIFWKVLEYNCKNGLPQGPIFSHFLASLLLYDLPIKFNDRFPDYHVTIYVDDINVYFYSNDESSEEYREIMNFLEKYLSKRLINRDNHIDSLDKNNTKIFLSEEKTSTINLNDNNTEYLLLAQELSAINLIKNNYRNLADNDKHELSKALENNLKDMKKLLKSENNSKFKSIVEKQERFTKYRMLLMVDSENELNKKIKEIFEKFNNGLFDKNFSNYINAIKANYLSFNLEPEKFSAFLEEKVLNNLELYTSNTTDIEIQKIKNYYNTVILYFKDQYKKHFIENKIMKFNKDTLMYDIGDLIEAIKNLKKDHEILSNDAEGNRKLYSNKLIKIKSTGKPVQFKGLEINSNENVYRRFNDIYYDLRYIFLKLFNVKIFSDINTVIPFNSKNKIYRLYEYRIIQYLLTSYSNIQMKLDYVITILEEHLGDREFEVVDPEIYEIIRIVYMNKCRGKLLDNIIVAHHFIRDIWKNGARDLPFYTLHNQEHSIELIKILSNLNDKMTGKLFSRMNKYEIYSLIMTIYVHDLGMLFYSNEDFLMGSQCSKSRKLEIELFRKLNQIVSKFHELTRGQILRGSIDLYKKIANYRTAKTRSEHAYNSRRFSNELTFIEDELKNMILEISNNHCLDFDRMYSNNIWYKKKKIEVKYISILLRVADVMDQSINRVSKVLYNYFDNYVEEMDNITLSHWAKHMLIRNINIEKEKNNRVIKDINNINGKKPKTIIYFNINFNLLPFKESYGKNLVKVNHDINESNHIIYNKYGRETRNLFDIFIDYFFKYVISEVNILNDFTMQDSRVLLRVKYTNNKNEKNKFENYVKALNNFLLNIK
ncbi:MAG: hypothetical protein FH753_12725, partial [Firmicutes bacterium]|nr:hypothetical protein [Bacillota bacterium]